MGLGLASLRERAGLAASVMKAGAAAYLVKDGAFEDLLAAIESVIRGESDPGAGIGPAMAAMPGALTSREMQRLRAIAEGLTNRAIAARQGLTECTVRFHVENICRKLGCRRRGAAVAAASRLGLV